MRFNHPLNPRDPRSLFGFRDTRMFKRDNREY